MTVLPTSYFPGVSYLKVLSTYPNCVLDVGEHYAKQTFRNRCSILTANGQQALSIPVIKPDGNKTATARILVSKEMSWRRDHWRAIRAAYASAPYFEHYESEIEALIFQETPSLVDFNEKCLNYINEKLELNLNYSLSETYVEDFNNDFRNFQFPFASEKYQQVLFNQSEFQPDLSILDALFCLGPMARKLILD